MTKRPDEVARLTGVGRESVEEVTVMDVRAALSGRVDPTILKVATQEPAAYWHVGDRYFLDDPYFGDVAEITDLAYDSDIGLHIREGGDVDEAPAAAAPPLHRYEVGKPYSPTRASWPEAVDYNYRQGGHELRLFWNDPSPNEIEAVRHGAAEFGLFAEGGLVVLLYRFGPDQGWSDQPFQWWLVPAADRSLPPALDAGQKVLLHMILINARTGVIEALRSLTFSPEFSAALHDVIRRQARTRWDGSQTYNKALARLYRCFPSAEAMLEAAQARCKGGGLEMPEQNDRRPAPDPALVSQVMGHLGSARTEAKVSAVRENGKLGGRPALALEKIPCTCDAGAQPLAAHKSTCRRRRTAYQRERRAARKRAKKEGAKESA